jgi:hypothetical protein
MYQIADGRVYDNFPTKQMTGAIARATSIGKKDIANSS